MTWSLTNNGYCEGWNMDLGKTHKSNFHNPNGQIKEGNWNHLFHYFNYLMWQRMRAMYTFCYNSDLARTFYFYMLLHYMLVIAKNIMVGPDTPRYL